MWVPWGKRFMKVSTSLGTSMDCIASVFCMFFRNYSPEKIGKTLRENAEGMLRSSFQPNFRQNFPVRKKSVHFATNPKKLFSYLRRQYGLIITVNDVIWEFIFLRKLADSKKSHTDHHKGIASYPYASHAILRSSLRISVTVISVFFCPKSVSRRVPWLSLSVWTGVCVCVCVCVRVLVCLSLSFWVSLCVSQFVCPAPVDRAGN